MQALLPFLPSSRDWHRFLCRYHSTMPFPVSLDLFVVVLIVVLVAIENDACEEGAVRELEAVAVESTGTLVEAGLVGDD